MSEETIRGDALTKTEMAQRNIRIVESNRGGVEFQSATYSNTIAFILKERGFVEDEELEAGLDYLELKNSVYGFLNAKTIMGILQTGDASLKRDHAEMAYNIVSKEIGKTNRKLIEYALTAQADSTLQLISVVEAYRTAFVEVLKALDFARRKIREQIEKELEVILY